MNSKSRIISFNCQSFNKKRVIIDSLLQECDIICLQETFITDHNNHSYDNLNTNFVGNYTSADRKPGQVAGRSTAGLAIFWRSSLNLNCNTIKFSDRIMGLNIKTNNFNYLLLNVYCFCDYDNDESLLNYSSMLADLSNISRSLDYDEVLIIGDFNADPNKGRFFRELNLFLSNNSMYANDINSLPNASYAYISPNSICGTSFINHAIASRVDLTCNHKVIYGYTFYDHVPIYCELNIPHVLESNNTKFFQPAVSNLVAWDKIDDEMKIKYYHDLENMAVTNLG